MKGGKDDEKSMSPMFPRLRVSDTEKGGPRAPPRNKMALYEQLSIPSQRFNSGTAAGVPGSHNNAALLVPVASPMCQGAGHERIAFPPFYAPNTVPAEADNIISQSSDGMHKSEPKGTKLTKSRAYNDSLFLSPTPEYGAFPLTKSKKSFQDNLETDNDFSVPTYVNPGLSHCSTRDQNNVDKERLTPSSPIQPSHSTEILGYSTQKAASAMCNSSMHLHSSREKHLKRTNTTDLWSRQQVRNHGEENPLEAITDKDSAQRTTSHLTCELSADKKHSTGPFDDQGRLHEKHNDNGNSQHDYNTDVPVENMLPESMVPTRKVGVSQVRSDSHCRGSAGNDRRSCDEYGQDQSNTDVDRNDEASDTSMLDSVSRFDISPDDVVGVIGQKYFWKARRSIINQQRLFAVQVFELHRIIKVQKLIAGSPHLLLEDTAYLSKPPLMASPAKKVSSEYLLKPQPQNKRRIEPQNHIQGSVCAAENAMVSPSPGGDDVNKEQVTQQSSQGQHHRDPTPPHAPEANKAGWSFHMPPGNQWLVPVMSPSEGLVYKPYAGPCPPAAGYMAPIYGGCGPLSVPSMGGGEFPTPYGFQPPNHQGTGAYLNPPFVQPYFSPYGMPMMSPVISASSVEHANPYGGAQSNGQNEQISTEEVNFNTHSRTSRNISNHKGDANLSGFKFQTLRESERQGSTASSPGEKAQKEGASKRAQKEGVSEVSEGRGALPLFPMASAFQVPEELPETQNSDQQHRRIIKVVPHNRRSANESAARIFQSIQEERQQYDCV